MGQLIWKRLAAGIFWDQFGHSTKTILVTLVASHIYGQRGNDT
jgi:hypothetical protein